MINKREFWGAIILIIGLILLVRNLDFIDYTTRRTIGNLWPVVFILAGIAFLITQKRRRVQFGSVKIDGSTGADISPSSQMRRVFGDITINADGMDIDDTNYSTTFGDLHLNLSGARLKTGSNRIDSSAVFGDIVIIIPGDIEVMAYASSTFGDLYVLGQAASGLSKRLKAQTDGYDSAEKKIQIFAGTTFGSIKIYKG
jgi:predicted membrane protein